VGFFGFGLKGGLGRKLRRRRVEFLVGDWRWVGLGRRRSRGLGWDLSEKGVGLETWNIKRNYNE
jgi:hypothetical protein